MPHIWKPIIRSRLDTDFYKFTMGQFIYHRYPHIPVTYGFRNRTKEIKIADFVDEGELRRELDHYRTLPITQNEIDYLARIKFDQHYAFQNDYLDFLQNCTLPNYQLEKKNGEYELIFPGVWSDAIYWESSALAIIAELTYRGMMNKLSKDAESAAYLEGIDRFLKKLQLLRNYPKIQFMEFGTRRRFSREWQDYVVATIKMLNPGNLMGTSNVWLAMHHGLKPLGTFAHELYMAFACIYHSSDDEIRRSHGKVLDEWYDEYGSVLAIALTDVYGSSFFFSDFGDRALTWRGLRQDSGTPKEFADAAFKFYKDCGIDPREKTILFSDGLTVDDIIDLHLSCREQTKDMFGWGTNLTNDLGFPSISIVIKLIECCGHPAVKLSDNLAKATGPAEEIKRYKKIFNYTGTLYEPCTY